jgi:Complex 1 protein (LYR family)
MQRAKTLSLYRRLLRLGQEWGHTVGIHGGGDKENEREYIVRQTRRVFRENVSLTDAQQIEELLASTDARIEIALHYSIPRPRLFQAATGATVEDLSEQAWQKPHYYSVDESM